MATGGDDALDEAVRAAMATATPGVLDGVLEDCGTFEPLPTALLNELLSAGDHHHHQAVAFELQQRADPSSVATVLQVLESGFEFMDSVSEDAVIAKWLSWVLAQIGDPAAVAVLQQFSRSPNREIAAEMRYRLGRLDEHPWYRS